MIHSPILAMLANKIHDPMTNGVSTRAKSNDVMGYRLTEWSPAFETAIGDAVKPS